jgi:hypothetical protein
MKNINSELDTVLRRIDHKFVMLEFEVQRDYDSNLYAYIYEKIPFNLSVKNNTRFSNLVHWQLVNKIKNI